MLPILCLVYSWYLCTTCHGSTDVVAHALVARSLAQLIPMNAIAEKDTNVLYEVLVQLAYQDQTCTSVSGENSLDMIVVIEGFIQENERSSTEATHKAD